MTVGRATPIVRGHRTQDTNLVIKFALQVSKSSEETPRLIDPTVVEGVRIENRTALGPAYRISAVFFVSASVWFRWTSPDRGKLVARLPSPVISFAIREPSFATVSLYLHAKSAVSRCGVRTTKSPDVPPRGSCSCKPNCDCTGLEKVKDNCRMDF